MNTNVRIKRAGRHGLLLCDLITAGKMVAVRCPTRRQDYSGFLYQSDIQAYSQSSLHAGVKAYIQLFRSILYTVQYIVFYSILCFSMIGVAR